MSEFTREDLVFTIQNMIFSVIYLTVMDVGLYPSLLVLLFGLISAVHLWMWKVLIGTHETCETDASALDTYHLMRFEQSHAL